MRQSRIYKRGIASFNSRPHRCGKATSKSGYAAFVDAALLRLGTHVTAPTGVAFRGGFATPKSGYAAFVDAAKLRLGTHLYSFVDAAKPHVSAPNSHF